MAYYIEMMSKTCFKDDAGVSRDFSCFKVNGGQSKNIKSTDDASLPTSAYVYRYVVLYSRTGLAMGIPIYLYKWISLLKYITEKYIQREHDVQCDFLNI